MVICAYFGVRLNGAKERMWAIELAVLVAVQSSGKSREEVLGLAEASDVPVTLFGDGRECER